MCVCVCVCVCVWVGGGGGGGGGGGFMLAKTSRLYKELTIFKHLGKCVGNQKEVT